MTIRLKRSIALLLCMLLLLSGCGSGSGMSDRLQDVQNGAESNAPADSTPAADDTASSPVDGAVSDAADDFSNETATPADTNSGDLDALCEQIHSVIRENFTGSSVTSSGSEVTVSIWFDGLTENLHSIQTSGGGADDPDWMSVKDNLVAMAGSICYFIDTSGYDDVTLLLNVLNDTNTDNVLLSIYETTIIYDVLDEDGTANQPSAPSTPDSGSSSEDLDWLCNLIESSIGENFDGCTVTNEDNQITASIWADGLTEEIYNIQTSGGGADNSDWMFVKDSMVSLAGSICDLIDTAGYSDVTLVLYILNDQNTNNVLLSIYETTIIYDVLE